MSPTHTTRLKTSLNNPDAALTSKGENMQVYVLNHKGRAIMPCSPRKARLLLKNGKAKVVKRTPFTIQWVVPTRSFTQPITLGVDSGYTHIGLSAVTDVLCLVLVNATINRGFDESNAQTDKRELYSADVLLRTDMVKLNSERRQYRRGRRYRKTWYRKPRFLNRKKTKGWLAPSIAHKLSSHIKVINQVKEILPISKINIEVAAFDIQKIKNPDISDTEYQSGEQKGFWNVREYVFHRDGHICQHCKGKSKDTTLEVHHIVSRQVGGNRPDNLITLCKSCHDKVSKGELNLKVTSSKGFKAETFMSMVRWKLRTIGVEGARGHQLDCRLLIVDC
jgi:N6-L-threonylcarbamoyladenine synthase